MQSSPPVNIGGLTQAAHSYVMATTIAAKERDRNRKMKAARRAAMEALEDLRHLATDRVGIDTAIAETDDDPGPAKAKENNDRIKQEILESLKTLESAAQRKTFEFILKQYAPDLISSYQRLIILAIARARELAGIMYFVTGDDYRQWGFTAIPTAAEPGALQGASVSAEELFG